MENAMLKPKAGDARRQLVNADGTANGRAMRRAGLAFVTRAVAVAVGLVLWPLAANANLFTNSNFATSLAGWTPSSAGACQAAFWTGGFGGSVELNQCGESIQDPSVSQTVNGLVIGGNYTIGWETRLHTPLGAGSGASFGVFVDGAVIDLSENLVYSFVADATSFVATSTSHTFTFAAELDTRTPGVPYITDVSYFLDNVSLMGPNPVPEPAMLSLFGLALAGLGLSRRRRTAPGRRGGPKGTC
jgi:hypothetical protein